MLIGTRKIKEEIIKQLVQDIKKKKELKGLADTFVKESLKKYLARNPKKISFLSAKFTPKSSNYKEIIKNVRGELRRAYSLFKIQKKVGGRRELFEELIKTKPGTKRFRELHDGILETHSSTAERLDFYGRLYSNLFKIIGKPSTILDLGSGLNGFSIPFMGLKKLDYFAYDIDSEEINLLNKYFIYLNLIWKKFSGKAKILDLLNWQKIKLTEVDVCFLWKMTDVLDQGKGHKVSEAIITKLPAKFVVVSFPTITSSGKPMNQPRRKWIELMCKRLNYTYKILNYKNEIFYVIEK